MRIASLLPSATEVICLLGLKESIVGITHECDYPEGLSHIPIVTRTSIAHNLPSREIDFQVREALLTNNALYTLDYALLDELQPDLLVTQSLCNVCAVDKNEVIDIASKLSSSPQVINLEPTSLNDMYATIEMVADATKCESKAQKIIRNMKYRVDTVKESTNRYLNYSPPIRIVYLEWIDPLFNSGYWISELIELAGGEDCLGNAHSPAKTIQWNDVISIDPDVLIVGCCGYDMQRTLRDIPMLKNKPGWKDLKCVKTKRTYMIDGNCYFSRPSPRLIDSLEILNLMLHSNKQYSDSLYKLIE